MPPVLNRVLHRDRGAVSLAADMFSDEDFFIVVDPWHRRDFTYNSTYMTITNVKSGKNFEEKKAHTNKSTATTTTKTTI